MVLLVCVGAGKAYHIAIGPFLVAVLCTLHPCSSKASKIASEFGLSPRVARAVVEVVIRAP